MPQFEIIHAELKSINSRMATRDDLEVFATKNDLNNLDRKLRAEANENFLALKELIDEAIGLIGVHTQDTVKMPAHKKKLESWVKVLATDVGIA